MKGSDGSLFRLQVTTIVDLLLEQEHRPESSLVFRKGPDDWTVKEQDTVNAVICIVRD